MSVSVDRGKRSHRVVGVKVNDFATPNIPRLRQRNQDILAAVLDMIKDANKWSVYERIVFRAKAKLRAI